MLTVNRLSKEFVMHIRDGVRIASFADVSLQVDVGSLLAITGPSGIGKSSLLKCIYRTYLPTSGEILYSSLGDGVIDLAAADDREILMLRRNEIGYVSQFLHVLPRVSAIEVLTEPLVLSGVDSAQAMDRAKELLSYVGLGKALWDMYPATFSGGEKQRLNILRAIIAEPRFLLLDEPTASLDMGYKSKVMELILQLKQKGTAMIGVFHDRDAISVLADRRYDLMQHGYCGVV